MAHRKRKPKWSLLLIRDADHRVKQFRVSSRTVVFLPTAAALTIAGCFATIELHDQSRIHDLQMRLANDSIQLASTVTGKNDEISSLEQKLTILNGQTEQLRNRINGLNELEQKLRQFIGKYGEGLSEPLSTKSTPMSTEVTASSFTAASSDRFTAAAMESTITDFSELSEMLDHMAVTMEDNLRKAEQKQVEMDAQPTGWPTVSRRLSSGFGYRSDPITGKITFHAGVDISGDVGDPVYAAGEGRVREAGFESSRGNYIIITHRSGLESWYMHLSEIGVKNDQFVERGDVIGEMGNSGRSTGPHLHFQVVVSEEPVNPLHYLSLVKED